MSNPTARFEALGWLYHSATGYLRPGQSEPSPSGRDSSSPENRERFEQWLATSALTAALDRIVELEDEVDRMNQRIGELT